LDNQYGDFDRHGQAERIGVELRAVEVATDIEDRGLREAWYGGGSANGKWVRRLWSEAAYWRLEESR
jgi:hypothetical protein